MACMVFSAASIAPPSSQGMIRVPGPKGSAPAPRMLCQ